MSKTNSGLVSHATAQLGLPYWYGTFGAVCSESLWQQKKKQYPSYYSDSRYQTAKSRHFGKRTYDCAGLVKSYMFQSTPTSSPKYNSSYDKNVSGLISACTKTGKIADMPETAGLLVFRNTSHVGIYIGRGYVIEAKGFDFGVVKTRLSAGSWDRWGQLGWIEYANTPSSAAKSNAPKVSSEATAAKSTSQAKNGSADSDTTELKLFKNTSGNELIIYADTTKLMKIGTLYSGSSCVSLGTKDNCVIIIYQVNGASAYKVGFTDYIKGLQK